MRCAELLDEQTRRCARRHSRTSCGATAGQLAVVVGMGEAAACAVAAVAMAADAPMAAGAPKAAETPLGRSQKVVDAAALPHGRAWPPKMTSPDRGQNCAASSGTPLVESSKMPEHRLFAAPPKKLVK